MSDIPETAYTQVKKYTCGLSLGQFIRFVCVLGVFSTVVYMAIGVYIIDQVTQSEEFHIESKNVPEPQALFQQLTHDSSDEDFEKEFIANGVPFDKKRKYTITIHHQHKGEWIALAVSLMVVSMIQFIADVCLIQSTYKPKARNFLTAIFILAVAIWIMTLICFVIIFCRGSTHPKFVFAFVGGSIIRLFVEVPFYHLLCDLRKLGSVPTSAKSGCKSGSFSKSDPDDGEECCEQNEKILEKSKLSLKINERKEEIKGNGENDKTSNDHNKEKLEDVV